MALSKVNEVCFSFNNQEHVKINPRHRKLPWKDIKCLSSRQNYFPFLKKNISCRPYIQSCLFLVVFLQVESHPLLWAEFSSVQSLSRVWLFATPWTAARQASLSITHSQSLPRLMSIESVMSSNRLILCLPLLLLPSIFPNIRIFSNESTLCIRWPKYWSFSFSISPSNEHPGLIPFTINWFDFLAVQRTLKSLP